MPRDEWRKATLRAKYGPVSYKTGRKQKRKPKNRSRTKQRAAAKAARKATGSGWSLHSKLWFGKYADKALSEVPEDYLMWLADNLTPGKSRRVTALVEFLRVYLQPETGKGVTR